MKSNIYIKSLVKATSVLKSFTPDEPELGTILPSYSTAQGKDNPVRDTQEILSWWEKNNLEEISQVNKATEMSSTIQIGSLKEGSLC